jgi:hypothetical protein
MCALAQQIEMSGVLKTLNNLISSAGSLVVIWHLVLASIIAWVHPWLVASSIGLLRH